MLSNEELKDRFLKVHPEYLENSKNGGLKWKTARIFSAILYPDSIEKDINECCVSFGVPCSLSPLHDADLKDEETGELKKAHYHFICYFKGKTTPFAFYSALVGSFGENAFSTFEIGRDLGSLVRYSCHLDNPEKSRYNTDDIRDFNGFCSSDYLVYGVDEVSVSERLFYLIRDYDFCFYDELFQYCLMEDDIELKTALVKNSNVRSQAFQLLRANEYRHLKEEKEFKRYHISKELSDEKTVKAIFNRQIDEASSLASGG